jgi:hypothetical protein
MGDMRNACRSSVEIPDRKREFGKLGIEGRVLIKYILEKCDVMVMV